MNFVGVCIASTNIGLKKQWVLGGCCYFKNNFKMAILPSFVIYTRIILKIINLKKGVGIDHHNKK